MVLLAALLDISSSAAASGNSMTLPTTAANRPGFSKDTGLQIVVDSTWSGERGYRPIQVTINSAKPVTGDTLLTIRMKASTWRYQTQSTTVEHDFEITQGATTVQSSFLVPQYMDWNYLDWEVWVDGVKDKALSIQFAGFASTGNDALAVGRLGQAISSWDSSSNFFQAINSGHIEEQVFDVTTLPETWLHYTSLDVLVTTPTALELARVSAPERLEPLLRWVRAGGNLWVVDVGSDFKQLPQVERILLPVQLGDVEDDLDLISLDPWKFLRFDLQGRQRVKDLVSLAMDSFDAEQGLSRIEIANSRSPNTAVDSRHWFIARSYGLGTVIALQRSLSDFKKSNNLTSALRRSSVADNLNWSLRHGNDPDSGNPNFNYWLISDVGAAPVRAFMFLITLFAIGIGPVNYWLLKRMNLLPMLLVTVPAAATLATVLLFLYGFLADGIETRVRARTLTVLDQSEGELATWARLSYYAGIAPSKGLAMPKNTAVYPVMPYQSDYSSFGNRAFRQQYEVEWRKQQLLTRGWLGSRTPTQYLTMTAQPCNRKLAFTRADKQLNVRNLLGTDVVKLIVQDDQGNLFVGEDISVDEKATLKPSNFVELSGQLRKIFSENLLQLPPGFIEGTRSRRNRNYGQSMTEGLMEVHFEAMTDPQAKGWGNGTYIAITSKALQLSLGLPHAKETESFHVVKGSWTE